ncbi:hypothetical protein ThidrDRAFT_1297 [Thiorhodococcus drewsii AZ1]|uniref:Uncharacterized protein n=1 Tax=Thiorhodococcus drewsii AZ1 TaxID=765913 RepID=G2DZ93_9GAMM|nr:hypothetical protein [Thiorhodococcus drewsii]EGV32447.1 hypothetical protein ThidrDRAFT_1297 [Thiorhodococcus drewsii AZ1]
MFVESFLPAFWQVLVELSPSLLLGLLVAGLMHVCLPTGFVHRGLIDRARAAASVSRESAECRSGAQGSGYDSSAFRVQCEACD